MCACTFTWSTSIYIAVQNSASQVRQVRARQPAQGGAGRGCSNRYTLIAAVLIVCASGVEHLILLVNGGHDPLVYGQLPLSYLFQTIDIAMIGVFGFFGLVEAIRIMRGDE